MDTKLHEYLKAKFIERLQLGDLDDITAAPTPEEKWIVVIQPYAHREGEIDNATYVSIMGGDDDGIMNFVRLNAHEEYPRYLQIGIPDEVLESSDIPRGVQAWRDAGISDGDIKQWFSNKIEEIVECAKDIAHGYAEEMTADDFLFDVEDDFAGDE